MEKSFVFGNVVSHTVAFKKRGRRGGGKLLRPALALAFIVGAVLCANAWADRGCHGHHGHHGHGRTHIGIAFGALLWRYGYGPGWYARPLVMQSVPPMTPIYIEQKFRSIPQR